MSGLLICATAEVARANVMSGGCYLMLFHISCVLRYHGILQSCRKPHKVVYVLHRKRFNYFCFIS
jgi:hypothetical protein